jgi:oligosaccharyltransferase complex subunit beta
MRGLTDSNMLQGLGPHLTPKLMLDFINAGGNILLTLSPSSPTPTALVSLLLELDIHLPADRSSIVVDHFNHDTISAAEKHDVILVPRPDSIRPDVKNFFRGNGKAGEAIAFPRGVGQSLGNTSPLLTPLLRAPRSAYVYNSQEDVDAAEEPFAAGQQLSLITTMQARNSARFTVVGSAEMLEDAWFDAKVQRSAGMTGAPAGKDIKTSNQAFATEVTGWTFKEIGVLKTNDIEHHLNEAGFQNISNPKIYRVKNDVVSVAVNYLVHKANSSTRHTQSNFPSTPGTNGFHLPPQKVTFFSLSSLCFRHSTVCH